MNVHHLAIGCALLATPPSAAAQHATRLPAARAAQPDTVRYVEIVDDEIIGRWSMWQESANTWGYASERRHHFARTGQLTLDGDGLPVSMDVTGEISDDVPWFERYELRDGQARWFTPRERGEADVAEPTFYAAVLPAHDPGVLARALLRRQPRTLPLLPAGEARLETLHKMTIEVDGRSRTVRLHAIHGRDLVPIYVWVDEDDRTFAEEWSILAGWEAAFPQLRAALDSAISGHRRTLARALIPPERTRPLAIRNARLFDPTTGRVVERTTIIIHGDRAALDALLRKVEESTAKENERARSEDRAAQDGILDAPVSRKALAEPNDNRQMAGRLLGGELRVELEVVEAEWYPRGPEGPRILTPAFAEPGRAPQVPGPLIRVAAGTPVRVSVRNTLDRAITVRGLLDRATMRPLRPPDADPLDADFFFADLLVVPPGETREVRFTPTSEVSSFYYGRVAPEEGGFAQPFLPGNYGNEGIFLGGLVVDAPGTTAPPDERVFLITRWAGRGEPSTLAVTFKFMINGLSWPFTERLDYQVGDTVRWRIINTSAITHPMHLHGFYFTVDARGDTDTDTVHAPGERQQAVTDLMADFSALRLTWVPDRPGNWLFHCHLIRHMSGLQRFASEVERATAPPGRDPAPRDDHDVHIMHDVHDMHDMAGLVMGLVIRPAADDDRAEPPAERTVHLWTSRAPGVFDERAEYSFVARDERGAPPLDTTVVPGSAIVLQQGQPTDIVVHNRLDFPLSVHWHGLEVRSLYDGVAGWSGESGAVRPAIDPGDSVRVRITPPRAGTFIYHIHGEAGHELSQGLYGPFLVLPEGQLWKREQDRVFVLAARGAERDPPPVVNSREAHPPERFEMGGRYRLRFIHISPDASKRVRLLRDAAPVTWRPLARDGADLPASAQVSQPAERDLGVGETFDVEWAPDEPGAYTLEVVTTHYSASGLRPTMQRVGFGVGNVTDEALAAAAYVEPPAPPAPTPLDTMAVVELDEAQLRGFVGAYTAAGVPVTFTVSWADGALWMSVTGREPRPLVPLSPTLFRWEDDQTVAAEFEVEDGRPVLVVFDMRLNRQAQ